MHLLNIFFTENNTLSVIYTKFSLAFHISAANLPLSLILEKKENEAFSPKKNLSHSNNKHNYKDTQTWCLKTSNVQPD